MIVTEKKKIKVNNSASCNAVYLRWENDLGGVDSYLFNGNTTEQMKVSGQVYFDKLIDDLLSVTSNFEIVSKEFDRSLKCNATFDRENLEAFRQLARSRKIELWHADKWWTVDVVVESLQVERFKLLGKISLRIIFNRTYVK
jgi:hypothetical protein